MPRSTRVVGAQMYTNACRQVAILNPDDASDARLPRRLAAQPCVERDFGDVTVVVLDQEGGPARVVAIIRYRRAMCGKAGQTRPWAGGADTN